MYQNLLKRCLDFILALTAFVIATPLFFLVAVLLAIMNRGKVFFFQPRPGLNGRIFRVIKFKTMNDLKDEHGVPLVDGMRLTKTGKVIRKLSFDEIPQLLNVIKGDMSLIGPRPLLVEYLPLYNEIQKRRHEVRPGITGWAQINGRNGITWEEKFKYDVWYVENVSFALDFKILLRTFYKVFKSEGINQAGHATMPKFEGTKLR